MRAEPLALPKAMPKPQKPRRRRKVAQKPTRRRKKLPAISDGDAMTWQDSVAALDRQLEAFTLGLRLTKLNSVKRDWTCAICGVVNDPNLDVDGDQSKCDTCGALRATPLPTPVSSRRPSMSRESSRRSSMSSYNK